MDIGRTEARTETAVKNRVVPVYVVVAAYREEDSISAVVRDLRRVGATVVVVDDGSSDATASTARSEGAHVLRHLINRGQGAALQTGLTYALACGASHVITFDADGQHDPNEIAAMLAPLLDGSADVVLGSRFLGSTPGMSRRRRWVLRVAVAFTRIMTGLQVTDTHNGFRAFTRDAASKIHLRQDRMAHASELLDQISQHELRVHEIPVTVRYTDYSKAKGQRSFAALRIFVDYLFGRWTR